MPLTHEAPKDIPKAAPGLRAADVWTAAFGHPCEHLPAPDYQALALDGINVIGVGNCYVRRLAGPGAQVLVGWMVAAAVLPERQGAGIGRQLLEMRHTWLKSIGVWYAALHCESGLYEHNEKAGYRRAPNVPGPGIAMVCELGGPRQFPEGPFLYREPW